MQTHSLRLSTFSRTIAFLIFALVACAVASPAVARTGPGSIGGAAVQGDQTGPHTAVRVFLAFDSHGLNPDLQVRARLPFQGNPDVAGGSCQTGSLATRRADAWRCGTADPCFQNPFTFDMDLVCIQSPWSSEVTILSVSAPLPSFQECNAGPRPSCRQELDITTHPWALELSNGVRCLPFLGTSIAVAGLRANYGCTLPDGTNAGFAVGDVDRSDPLWRIFYLAPGAYEMDLVEISTAWY